LPGQQDRFYLRPGDFFSQRFLSRVQRDFYSPFLNSLLEQAEDGFFVQSSSPLNLSLTSLV
jgi:hypothetical protein